MRQKLDLRHDDYISLVSTEIVRMWKHWFNWIYEMINSLLHTGLLERIMLFHLTVSSNLKKEKPSCVMCGVWGRRSGAMGKAVLPYLIPYLGYFILLPRCLVGEIPCPRKSQKNYTKEKTATDKRGRRFFYTFL